MVLALQLDDAFHANLIDASVQPSTFVINIFD